MSWRLSALTTAGANGGQVGAQIVKRRGVRGTLFGEPGFEDLTATDLWPWPYQARIKSDMASVSTRGFCSASTTLSSYVFGLLGNPSPY